MPFTTLDYINIAKVSQYLASDDISKGNLFGPRKIPITPRVLYMERMAVEWMYNLDPNNSTLALTGPYLYSLCRGYNLKAQNILNIGGGGSISPITPSGSAPNPYDWEVTPTSEPLADGESTVTLTDLIGFNIIFSRGGIVQSTVNQGSYYSWNRVTGQFECFPQAFTGEQFIITPV